MVDLIVIEITDIDIQNNKKIFFGNTASNV